MTVFATADRKSALFASVFKFVSLYLFDWKKSHGATASTKKITLQRKETSTLKTGQGGKKSVAIEVRKKRTYVKRDDTEAAQAE